MSKNMDNELCEAFKLFDRDGTGFITFDILKQIAADLGEEVSDTDLQDMIDEVSGIAFDSRVDLKFSSRLIVIRMEKLISQSLIE